MRCLSFTAAALLAMGVASASADTPYSSQNTTGTRPGHEVGIGESLPRSNRASNIVPGDTRSIIAPTLPGPAIGDNQGPHDYLAAARAALIAGHTGQAQQSLEMAETRALDRSVPQGQTNAPSDSPLVSRIDQARRALGSGDRAHAIQIIDSALSS